MRPIHAYDPNGNRTERDNATTLVTQTLTYTTGTNQLATEDSQAVVHDSAGNRTSDNGGTRTYAYNHAGRMTPFTESSVVQADYTYNAQGQRVKKVRHVGASDYVRHFFYGQAGQLIGEYRDNPDGTYAYVDYIWLNGAPLVQEERSYNSSDVLTGTQTTWLHVDHLNTPRVGTNDSKVIVWRWDSDPFGVGDADSDPDNDTTDHVVLLRFPGQYEDEESGHYYNYFRDYDPATGRYAQSDPIGSAGGLNRYAYVGSSPVSYFDRLGLARFGFRPLQELADRYDQPDGSSNHHAAHEQLWFDDNPMDNVGFFAGDGSGAGPQLCGEDGVVRPDYNYARDAYDMFGPSYNDHVMRQAVNNIRDSWNDGSYCFIGQNCQHFADALRSEYDRLTNRPQCHLTRRGMRCR